MSAPEYKYTDYDAGYLNDKGGGDVDWWQDYIRVEIERANGFHHEQYAEARETLNELVDKYTRTDIHEAALARIAELEADLERIKRLKRDPVAVHVNMLQGQIAKPLWSNILHLYPTEHAKIMNDVARIGELEAAARLFIAYHDRFDDGDDVQSMLAYGSAIEAAKAAMKDKQNG